MDKELEKLRFEIDVLKKQKERKLQLTSSIQEKRQLEKEIKELDIIRRDNGKLKLFSNSVGKRLNKSGKLLWKNIVRGSRNLEQNDMRLQKLARNKQLPSSPYSDLAMLYIPHNNNQEPVNIKKVKLKRRNKQKRQTIKVKSGISHPFDWELP